MAITGIDTIEGKQIIAAGAVSAKSAEMAYNDENGNPITGYLTAVPEGYATTGDLTAYQTTAGMTAYQSAGDYYSASNPSGFITGLPEEEEVEFEEIDLTDYQPVSSMTAYQSAGDYYSASNPSGFISEVPTGTMNESAFGYDSDNKISSYNGSAIGGTAPTYDYTDNDLISSIDTSGLYATSGSANHLIQGGTMGGNIVQNSGSNNFYYMPKTSPWPSVTGIYSPLQYATGACLAMDAGNFKAYFKGNEWFVGNTAIGQALRGEVHQSRGVHISGATTAGDGFNLGIKNVSGVNSTGSWKYGHNEDAALRAVSSCDMHESAFEYDASDNITAYNGSAFAGGSEVPEGVMSESGLEYNAVNEISGYNGSAIAQYGAEKQWLVVDDTLLTLSNSAQFALGVNISAVAQLLGVDETVLQDNIANSATTFTLSEPAGNFDRLRLYDSYGTIAEVSGNNNRITWTFDRTHSNGTRMNRCYTITSNNGIDWNEVNVYGWNQTAYTGALTLNGGTNWYLETIKIVGIGRKN